MIRVTVWNEFFHEKTEPAAREVYPNGIHACIKEFLSVEEDITVRTATQDEEECGLTREVLDNTDVLIWWGHVKQYDLPLEIAERVKQAVLAGMGIIFLHSSHLSRPFCMLMGTACNLKWREDGDKERLWIVDPSHPIVQGVGDYVLIPNEETYCEPFGIPEPDKLIMIGAYEGGEVFRSGCCWRRGYGKVFYFQPGHETYPVYRIPEIQTIIKNAVRWCEPTVRANIDVFSSPNIKKLTD